MTVDPFPGFENVRRLHMGDSSFFLNTCALNLCPGGKDPPLGSSCHKIDALLGCSMDLKAHS